MYLRQMEYVLVVAEERSISKAAKRLYIAQPSLSQNIQSIEKELGTKLFERTNIGLILTYAGEQFVKAARDTLDIQHGLQQQICDINDSAKGRLTIGISIVRGSLILPLTLPIFHEQFPGIEINLLEGTSSELEEFIENGRIDLAILDLPLTKQTIEYETLLTEDILVAVPPHHELAQNSGAKPGISNAYTPISFFDISKEPFVVLKFGSRLRQLIDTIFQQNACKQNILLESNSIVTVHHLVAAGMGLTFIGESVARFDRMSAPPVYFAIEEFHLTRTLVIAYRQGRYLTKAAREFIAITQAAMKLTPEGQIVL